LIQLLTNYPTSGLRLYSPVNSVSARICPSVAFSTSCPPWNDEIPHHYRFKLFACDFSECSVQAIFNGQDVLKATEGHILAETELTGLYSLNPEVG
jgi:phosphatidylethanolamine-binding protein (PEBP) family uncharacterized protein